jgi:branched-chain amino acid transport system ATP-binding protein
MSEDDTMQMNEPGAHFGTGGRQIGPVILDLRNISLAFGGVKALTNFSFDMRSTRSAPSSARTAPARARC